MNSSVPDEILVVDDTVASLKLIGNILGDAGYRVRLAHDGALALRSARLRPPALVLLDISMPGINGYEVCQRLKADPSTASVPIIFLSVLEEEHDKSLAFQLGAVDYVNKPVRAAEVLARVRTHLTLRRTELELLARNRDLEAARELLECRVRERSAELERTNQKLVSVLRAATAYSIVATEPNGVIAVMNEGAELMLGYRAADLIQTATPLMFHDWDEVVARAREERIEPGFEVFVRKARSGAVDTNEWTYVRRDGSRLTVSLTVTAMRNEDGEITGFMGIARDVTAEKQLEQQLLQSQKMECVGLLSGGVAHDFNNLLTPIKGYAELIKMSLPDDDPLQHDVAEIQRAAGRARELTQQLLAFSRKQIIELRALDLRAIVEGSANILRRTIRENVEIVLALPPSAMVVRADAGQLEVVLVNLSINAQDAMPDGGTLRIELADVTLEPNRAAAWPGLDPGPYVTLTVTDSGVGMDRETMTRIFEPFFTTKDVGKGTGLGLSTVYGIIRQHGGAIDVSSDKGKGSAFTIMLPRLGEVAVSEQPEPLDTVLRGTETILVVEDNQMVRALLAKLLPGLGYELLMAGSAEECLALASTHTGPIHLLLTDVVMPGLNGRELYARLRETAPELKVLFMSGYATDAIGHPALLDADAHFLYKPFKRSELSAKIRQALGSAG